MSNDFRIYKTTGGETLAEIAGTFTFSADYAPALVNFNGFDAYQAESSYAFPPNELIAIPENWINWKQLSDIGKAALALPPGRALEVTITGSGGKAPAVPAAPLSTGAKAANYGMLFAVAAVLFLMSFSERKKS